VLSASAAAFPRVKRSRPSTAVTRATMAGCAYSKSVAVDAGIRSRDARNSPPTTADTSPMRASERSLRRSSRTGIPRIRTSVHKATAEPANRMNVTIPVPA
jgi:hypothetical protein